MLRYIRCLSLLILLSLVVTMGAGCSGFTIRETLTSSSIKTATSAPINIPESTSTTLVVSSETPIQTSTPTSTQTPTQSTVSVDITPPSTPTPRSPSFGGTMPQPTSPWTFDWDDSNDPESGIKGYQLRVFQAGSIIPFINIFVTNSTFTCTPGGYITEASQSSWIWQVIALNGAGQWSNWTSRMTFSVLAATTTTEIAQFGTRVLQQHFSQLGVGKMPAGWSGNPWDSLVKNVSVFDPGDQFALYVSIIKEVTVSGGFYSVIPGQQVGSDYPYRWYNTPSPRQLGTKNLSLTPGQYKYGVFADGVLVAVFPIEVR